MFPLSSLPYRCYQWNREPQGFISAFHFSAKCTLIDDFSHCAVIIHYKDIISFEFEKKTRKISLNQSHIVLKMKSAKVCTNSLHCPVFGIEVEVIKAHWVHKAILFWYCSILSLVNTLWSLWCAIVLEMMIRCLLVQPSTLKIDLLRLPSEQLTTSRSTWPM